MNLTISRQGRNFDAKILKRKLANKSISFLIAVIHVCRDSYYSWMQVLISRIIASVDKHMRAELLSLNSTRKMLPSWCSVIRIKYLVTAFGKFPNFAKLPLQHRHIAIIDNKKARFLTFLSSLNALCDLHARRCGDFASMRINSCTVSLTSTACAALVNVIAKVQRKVNTTISHVPCGGAAAGRLFVPGK